MLERLSYRVKVPLNISALVLITVLVITLSVLGWNYRALERELAHSGQSLGLVIAQSVGPAMLRDDVWAVWETIRTPRTVITDEMFRPGVITLVDRRQQVFASTDPQQFRMLSRIDRDDHPYGSVRIPLDAAEPGYLWLNADRLLTYVPVQVDGSNVGMLLLEYQRPNFFTHFAGALGQTAVATVSILALLLPIGWLMGQRIARPLQELASLADRVGSEAPAQLQERLAPAKRNSSDELERLRVRFHDMLGELAGKQSLEREVVRSDRLAAMGRLTAGIAHEINNPLGGMLNALSTQRRHGQADPVTQRTLSLLERGLVQIRDIVGALLVEARLSSQQLRREDVADIDTLIQTDSQRRDIKIAWHVLLPELVPLPATPIRQILINLLLNAVKAAGPGGAVSARVVCPDDRLTIEVINSGPPIEPHVLEHLFEPFYSGRAEEESGSGLGLWVTYQIVTQLQGHIDVNSRSGLTRFRVLLPLPAQQGRMAS